MAAKDKLQKFKYDEGQQTGGQQGSSDPNRQPLGDPSTSQASGVASGTETISPPRSEVVTWPSDPDHWGKNLPPNHGKWLISPYLRSRGGLSVLGG